MAVAVTLEFADTTVDQYDQVMSLMELTPHGAGPDGLLFHWAAKTDGGMRVTDVWQSRERFDQFAQEQIGPLTAKAGITSAPTMTFMEVHNYLTAGK